VTERVPAADRVRISVDGVPLDAERGTSLLAALWNAGLLRVRRSVTGEQRGALCGMGTCFECRVAIDGVRHRRACDELVRPGMEVSTLG
jgi:predicted molibdopterin-dependent oxidoreductase YjgC